MIARSSGPCDNIAESDISDNGYAPTESGPDVADSGGQPHVFSEYRDLLLSRREQIFRDEARAWLESVVPSLWGSSMPPSSSIEDEEYALRRRFDRALFDGGWAGLSWPTEYGGRGATLRDQLLFSEECAAARAPELFNRVALGIVAPALMMHGSTEQKRRFLPAILRGDEIWCQGFSEPNAGSDLASLATRARLENGRWIIEGQKVWTTLAQFADHCFLLARSNSEKSRHHGITALIVPMLQPGVIVRPIRQINGSEEFSEVFFDGASVDPEGVIGQVDHGWEIAMSALSYERSTNFALRQIRTRYEVAELLDLISTDPSVWPDRLKERLADLYVRSEALRQTVWANITAIDAGSAPGIQTNASKVFWSELSQDIANLGLEMLGYDGIVSPTGAPTDSWARRYLWSRAASIYAGTNEIQRNLIAERGFRLPR